MAGASETVETKRNRARTAVVSGSSFSFFHRAPFGLLVRQPVSLRETAIENATSSFPPLLYPVVCFFFSHYPLPCFILRSRESERSRTGLSASSSPDEPANEAARSFVRRKSA